MNNGDMPATAVDRYTITEEVQIKGAKEGTTMTQGVAANGFTKREAFAMAAMEGDWASQNETTGEFHTGILEEEFDGRSRLYVKAANALLKALEE